VEPPDRGGLRREAAPAAGGLPAAHRPLAGHPGARLAGSGSGNAPVQRQVRREREERQGAAGAQRRGTGGGPGPRPPDAPQEAAAGHRGAAAAGDGPLPADHAAGPHLGGHRVAAGHRTAPVRGALRAVPRRRPDAGHALQEGAREVPGRHAEVPPGQHCSR